MRGVWLVPGRYTTDIEAICGGSHQGVSSTECGVGQSVGASGCNLPGEFVDSISLAGEDEESGVGL